MTIIEEVATEEISDLKRSQILPMSHQNSMFHQNLGPILEP